MPAPTTTRPPTRTGYLRTDVERYLAAAEERAASLREAIAEARRRRDVARARIGEGREVRRLVATTWLEAQRDAERVRVEVEVEARAIIQQAEALAASIRR